MKKGMKGFFAKFACTAIVLSSLFSVGVAAAETDKVINVSGTATLEVAPDTASIDVGIRFVEETSEAAAQKGTEIMDNMHAALVASGISAGDISTNSYYISPEYDYNSADMPIIGYMISHQYTVTIRNLSQLNKTLEICLDSGANILYSVRFSVEDSAKYDAQLYQAAYKDARRKADAIAVAMGATVIETISVSESFNAYYPMYSTGASSESYYDTNEFATVPENLAPETIELGCALNYYFTFR